MVSVGLAALVITVVAVNIWMRAKGENIHRFHFYKKEHFKTWITLWKLKSAVFCLSGNKSQMDGDAVSFQTE